MVGGGGEGREEEKKRKGQEGRKTGGEWRGDKKERKGRGREVGGRVREGRNGKGKEILMFRGQENILNGCRVEI